MTASGFERLSRAASRRPALTLGIVLALAIAGGLLALGLRPSAGIDTFVGSSSPSYRATADEQRHFGDEAVIVLVSEPLPDLVQAGDLGRLTQLEACLAGQYAVANAKLHAFTPVRAGTHAPYGGWGSPCGRLMRSRATQVVYGPGTFLNRAVAAVNTEIAAMLSTARKATQSAESNAYRLAIGKGMSPRQARAEASAAGRLESADQLQSLETLAVTSGLSGVPSIDDQQFIARIVFDSSRGSHQPKARFAYLFPSPDAALIQVRLRSTLTDAQRARAISWIRQAVRMPMFGLAHGGTYTVTGVPVVINDLATTITGSIGGLLAAALLVMAVTLLAVFRGEPSALRRLLPLAIALVAVGITFGLLAVLGAGLTLASIAVLPILIGLAVDYGVQFQARVGEARAAGLHDGRASGSGADASGSGADASGSGADASGSGADGTDAVGRAAGRAAPAIGAAALATGTGFLVLLLSPVPMVRGFGVLLVVGIAVAFACAVTAGAAALAYTRASVPASVPARHGRDWGALGASARGAGELLRPAVRGASELLGAGARAVTAPLGAAALSRPGRVLVAAAVLAALGWGLQTQIAVQSDVTRLVPASMPALRDLRALERVTGVSGEIDVVVHGSDVATPATVSWMTRYENQLLRHFGYVEDPGGSTRSRPNHNGATEPGAAQPGATQPCARATLCPALSLPDLFLTGASPGGGAALTRTRIDALLAAVPAYFSQAVITPDRREATLAFGIRLMPLARQQRVIDYMRSRLRPPAGVTAALAGLPVLAAQANASLSSTGRRLLTLVVGLLAVGLVLLAALRRVERAVVPMIPIVLATGWSSLILYLIGIPLNPMSATLGTLVIAISTEFSVLLCERCRQERAAGLELRAALARTYRSTGAAVLTSGITAIMGFGVLILSDIPMLRDFGLVTLIDLSVSLAGVLLVLPAVLALHERARARRLRDTARAPRVRLRRPRRRARVA